MLCDLHQYLPSSPFFCCSRLQGICIRRQQHQPQWPEWTAGGRRWPRLVFFISFHGNPQLCICWAVPPDDVARHTRPCSRCGRKCRYLAQHRCGKAPKCTNSIYCSKECELTTAAPETSTAAKGYRAIAALVARLGCHFEDPPSLRPILTWSRPTVRHGTGPFYCVVPINPSNQLARPGITRLIHRNWTTVGAGALSAWKFCLPEILLGLVDSGDVLERLDLDDACRAVDRNDHAPRCCGAMRMCPGHWLAYHWVRDIASRHLVDHRGPRLALPALLARECGSSRPWRLCCKSDP